MCQISIIVPIYNTEQYLEKCIESIRRQSFTDIEIILVDDGSRDGSGKKCDFYALQDERIRVIHKANGGLSSARNCGLECAKGEYVMFVDSDDYVDEHMAECLYAEAISKDADIVICNYFYVNDGGEEVENRNYTFVSGYGPFDRIKALTLFEDQSYGTFFDIVWNKIFKRKLFDGIRFPEGISLVEDISVIPMLYYEAKAISIVSDKLYYYVQRAGSLSNGSFSRSEDYKLRRPMMEKRLEYYVDWNIKELILIHYIHLYSLIAGNGGDKKDLNRLQQEYRIKYFGGGYCGQVSFSRKVKFFVAALSLKGYHKLAERK